MSSYVHRPQRKMGLFDQKIYELHHALRNNMSAGRISRAAEKVRSAKLGVIKGWRASISDQPEFLGNRKSAKGIALMQRLSKLDDDKRRWTLLSVGEIIQEVLEKYPFEEDPTMETDNEG